jgi:NADH:ubiquinone reductase (H+-translocating)
MMVLTVARSTGSKGDKEMKTITDAETTTSNTGPSAAPGELAGPTTFAVVPRRHARPRVVIVGAGFGGLNAARALAGKNVDVLLLDRNNYHGFWPLLYQVATAGLEPDSIAYPVRGVFHKWRNINFRMASVRGIDMEQRQVLTESAPESYDYLILAAGSANNYFGNDSLARNTYGLKDIDDAEKLRNRILLNFERASTETDPEQREKLMTIAIIGGGPTGVELAGAFSELIRHVLRKDYPALDVLQSKVILIEAGATILPAFPESLRRSAQRRLAKMGVEVKLNAPVESVEKGAVTLKGGTVIEAGTVVWAAGVRASRLGELLDSELGKQSRVKVEPTLNLPGHPEVFVVGDMAYLEGYRGKEAYPMVAQVAIQQGKRAARNILAQLAKQQPRPFRYLDYGIMATIGRRSAVLDAFGLRLSGRLAWFGWLFIHIMYLIGFRNRLIVMTNWAYNYFTFERGVRLITGEGT